MISQWNGGKNKSIFELMKNLNVNEQSSDCRFRFSIGNGISTLQVCVVFCCFICFGENGIILQGGSDSMQRSTIQSLDGTNVDSLYLESTLER